MLGAIQSGSEQVVAAAVADDDRPAAGVLYVEDAGHEPADRACEMPSRLEDERRIERARDFGQPAHVGIEVGLRAAVIGDAKSSAGVEVSKPDPFLGQLLPELGRTARGLVDRLRVEELGADMEREADGVECFVLCSPA